MGNGNGRIKVTWDGFDDYALDGFDIYRNTAPNTDDWTLVHEYEEATSGEWVDTNVANGTLYYYWLNILDCYGNTYLTGPQSTTTGYMPTPTPTPAFSIEPAPIIDLCTCVDVECIQVICVDKQDE